MNESLRTRLAWIVVAAAIIVGLADVLEFYATGTFPDPWLPASIIVYAALLVLAIGFAVIHRAPPAPTHAPTARGDPKLVERVVTYQAREGMAVRLSYVWPDGGTEIRHVAITRGESRPLSEIESELDAFPSQPSPPDMDDGIDAVLRKWARPAPSHDDETASEPKSHVINVNEAFSRDRTERTEGS